MTFNRHFRIIVKMFKPNFIITAAMAKNLMSIEANRRLIEDLPIDVTMLASLRETARLMATHYSTQIEGNRLTEAQVKEAIAGVSIPGRERDSTEVQNHDKAIQELERLANAGSPITELAIQRLQGAVLEGQPNAKPYRDGQNVIRDSRSEGIVYMPPEAKDVPGLMKELVDWINEQIAKRELPTPLVAGIAHYQYATIHPYYDGNGRTARLLATLILHRSGYDMKGIYSLEAYYAKNLPEYYQALTVGPSHNYYLGRAEADITPFLEYFCHGMAEAFEAVKAQAQGVVNRQGQDWSAELRELGSRERRLLELFSKQGFATAAEMAEHLNLSHRTVMVLCREWVANGLLEIRDASRKGRSYRLSAKYERMIGR